MDSLLLLAAKSFIVAGGALLLLQLMRKRSAADRSWIAHLALVALLLLPIGAFALPALEVQGPSFLVGEAEQAAPVPATLPAPVGIDAAKDALKDSGKEVADGSTASFQAPATAAAPVDWPFWGYAVPAALLILLTLTALGRLAFLKSRATVLVEPEWLTALARAQRRMGFKHGTALLTSDELPSPISWGVIRPVILLNSEAAKSHSEAEAIITHELAHVARLDWAKLMLSRLAVALFWFNPLVWLLAREAHQLREEAADDSVLAADIEDTDYARLLVGVARHECRGMLIGAHGVAPSRNSLSRRIKRVLDTATARAPGGWRWASAAGFFAAGMAVPVAALNLVAPSNAASTETKVETPYYVGPPAPAPVPVLPDTVANATASAVQSAVQAATRIAPDGSGITVQDGKTILRGASGSTITVFAPDSKGLQRVVMRGASGSVLDFPDARVVPGIPAMALAGAHPHKNKAESALDQAIAMKAVGVTPEYAAAMRSRLGHLDSDDLVELRAVGVTPEYIQDLANAGFRGLDKERLVEARAVGVRPDYVRDLARAGYSNLTLDQLVELRAVGVTAAYIEKLRRAGYGRISVDKLVEMRAVGLEPEDLRRDDGG